MNSLITDTKCPLVPPPILYHGTWHSFSKFNNGDIGFHFGSVQQALDRIECTKPKNISGEGREPTLISAYLDIKNPLDIVSDLGDWNDREMWIEYLGPDNLEVFTKDQMSKWENVNDIKASLIEAGYDGIKYENLFEGDSFGSIEYKRVETDAYIAFFPEQIKIIAKISGEQVQEIKTCNNLKGVNMGVGVYARDFDDFGTTFLVSPFSYITEENFNSIPKEDRGSQDFEDFVALESENAQDVLDGVIAEVTRNFDGDFLKPHQRTWDDDMLIMAEIGDIQIYTRGWEHDAVIGIAPHKHARDLLDEAHEGYHDKILQCIDEFGAHPDKVTDTLALQVKAVKRDLIAHFQEAGMEPRYKTSDYTTSPYSPMEPAHPESEEEARKQKSIRLEPFAKFTDQDKLDAFDKFIEDAGLSNYYFMVNKDERGEFYADVRKILDNETVFEIKSDENGEIPMVRDGFMKNKEDLEGLEEYLREQGIIENTADLYLGGESGNDQVEDIIYDSLGSDKAREDFVREYEELREKIEEKETLRPG